MSVTFDESLGPETPISPQNDFIPPEYRLKQIRNEVQKVVELIGKKLDENQVADMVRKKEEVKGQKKMYSRTKQEIGE